MRILTHIPLSPASRQVRLALAEKGLDCVLKEKSWPKPIPGMADSLPVMDPATATPELVDEDQTCLLHASVICDYLEETYPERTLLGTTPVERAEARRLAWWFERRFSADVTDKLLGEKLMKRLAGTGAPDVAAIRTGHARIHGYMEYLTRLAEERRWLAGDRFGLADIAAASQLSALDYFGDVPWEGWPGAKDWYARLKSRPSFRPLLADRIPGMAPPGHYADLDF